MNVYPSKTLEVILSQITSYKLQITSGKALWDGSRGVGDDFSSNFSLNQERIQF